MVASVRTMNMPMMEQRMPKAEIQKGRAIAEYMLSLQPR